MKIFKQVLKTVALMGFLVSLLSLAPLGTSAANPDNKKIPSAFNTDIFIGATINSDGEVKGVGAKVIGVSANNITAITMFGDSQLNWTVKSNNDTNINGKSRNTATLHNLRIGDRISFIGNLSDSTNNSLIVDATHIVSRALMLDLAGKTNFEGKIVNVNFASNSFTIEIKGRTLQVKTTDATVITIDNQAAPLASLDEGEDAKIVGIVNADLTVITAKKVTVDEDEGDDEEEEEDKENKKVSSLKKVWLWGLGNVLKK